ncbi:GNAT family N-acetyltransferase [Lederbergia galactosidilytica]|nr:GNAT family N-acetyltransferase [Lederbergia galactosidilytica]
MQSIEIQMLPSQASSNLEDMKKVTNIVNDVYGVSEENLWMDGAVRTTVEEIAEYTENGEIAVARSMEQIIGCVRVTWIDKETGELGMLAVDEQYQGTGIGRKLILFAEEKCRNEEFHKMQLELLVPEEGSHPSKVILENWYTRLGYQQIRTDSFAASFPRLAQLLAIPCKLVVFQKQLKKQAVTSGHKQFEGISRSCDGD